jgi:nucleotide-binding universal stress UspA family protein
VALKELLVHLDQTDEAGIRLRLGMDLARRHGSRLTALFVDEWNIAQPDQRPTPELQGAAQTAGGRLRADLEEFQRGSGTEFEWQYVRDFADAAVKQAALYADLCILGQQGASNCADVDRRFCANVVAAVGVPLLFVPTATHLEAVGRRIVVAWDGSRTAARALTDAMALIESSDQTIVLNIDSGMHQQSIAGLNRVAERLRRHGTRASAQQIEAREPIGAVLQTQAQGFGADLIVAGAYGHARAIERIFGGVTRDLLHSMRIPLLLSH